MGIGYYLSETETIGVLSLLVEGVLLILSLVAASRRDDLSSG